MLQSVIRAYVYNQPAARAICDRLGVKMLALEFLPQWSEYRGTYTAPHMSQPETFSESTGYCEAPMFAAARAHLDRGVPLDPTVCIAARYVPTPHMPANIRLMEITDPQGVKSSYSFDANSSYGLDADD